MPALDPEVEAALEAFLAQPFAQKGGVITDLDGTAVLEHEGRVIVAPEVELGLKRLADAGRPVAINTLRFPLNVIRTFGRAWAAISDKPLPLVSLNGAITGYLTDTPSGTVVFEELDAVVLTADEIAEVMTAVRNLTAAGIDELLLFHYPRDWTAGELIWTPVPDRVTEVRGKYASASEVYGGSPDELAARLAEREFCMLFLLVEAPEDRLMAYQHARPSSFVTHAGVNKLAGAQRLADRLGFDLGASIGCGDTPMDTFLNGCGLAVLVGGMQLDHRGKFGTVRVPNVPAMGEMLDIIAERLPPAPALKELPQ